MPTRKISGPDNIKNCMDADHDVPMFQVFEPGTYEHECPSCGKIIRFTIPEKTMWKQGPGHKPFRLEQSIH